MVENLPSTSNKLELPLVVLVLMKELELELFSALSGVDLLY